MRQSPHSVERDRAEWALLQAARQYRTEVIPAGDEDERSAAEELDAAFVLYDAFCPLHGGYDPDQRGPGYCPYCVRSAT